MNPPSNIRPERILVRGVNWLGDAVMTTPALLRLRERFPTAYIALLTPEKLRGLWENHPALNDLLSFKKDESVWAVSRRLRSGQYTHAVVLPNSPRSALEVFLAGIPFRLGYARPWRNWLLTQRVSARPEAVKMHKRSDAEIRRLVATGPAKLSHSPSFESHQIHEYLHLMAAMGANPDPLAPFLEAPLFADTNLTRFFLPGSRRASLTIGLNPGAEYGPAKRWPLEYFAAAANELYQRHDCEFLIFGGPADTSLADQLQTLLPAPKAKGHVTALAGKTTLPELMSALAHCQVVISNDTGPMHVAAAVGTAVVAPFGSTSPELTGPGQPGDPRHRLLKSDPPCAPCFRRECPIDFRCLRGITAHQVVEAVCELLPGIN